MARTRSQVRGGTCRPEGYVSHALPRGLRFPRFSAIVGFGILALCGIQVACSATELSFLVEPHDVVCLESHPLSLHCFVEGIAPIAITWRHNGKTVVLMKPQNNHSVIPSNPIILTNGTLFIPEFKAPDGEGEYECTVQNHYGLLVSRKARVQAAILSQFQRHPQTVSTEEGGVARFQCQIHGLPEPLITWDKDRMALHESTDDRYTVLPAGVLQIAGVQPKDSGSFCCVATNIAGRRVSRSVRLVVAAPDSRVIKDPVIVSGPQNLTITVHETAILECIATGHPRPIVSWSRLDGHPISVEGIQVLGTGNLIISDVAVQHSGVYVCAANKPGTRVRRTAQGRLNVQAPPEFVQWPHSLSRALGTPAVFTCSAQGTPPPHITWLRNGQPLQPSEHVRLQHSNSTLAIHQVHVDDEGLYQCRAENIAGSVQASARLAVLGAERLPGPPLGLEARTVSPISVLLAWHEPQHNANELIGYVVHIRRAQDPEEQEYQEAVSKSTVEHLVTELDPSTMYIFFVKAYSSRGASQPSITITAETLGEVPAVPALHVRVLNSSAVQLSWEPSSKLGRVQGFKLYYRKIYAPHLTGPVSLPANITAHTLAHLAVQSSYEIRLLAFNEFGNGNFSARLISLKENPQASLLEPSTSDCKTETWHDGHSTTGIIIGIHIGLACIVVCALFLLLGYRRRLFWWLGMNIARTRQQSRNGNGPHMGADHTNGIVGDRGRSTHPSIITTDGKCTSRELLAEPRELESLVQTPEPVPLLQLANESQNILLMDEVRDLHSLNPQSSRVAEKILPHESGLFGACVMKETTLQEPEGQLTSVEDTAVIAVPICPDASSPGTSSTTGPDENCVSSKLPNSNAALPAEESASTMAVLLSVAAGRCHGKVVVKDSESTLH